MTAPRMAAPDAAGQTAVQAERQSGTMTRTVLTQAIVREGAKAMTADIDAWT